MNRFQKVKVIPRVRIEVHKAVQYGPGCLNRDETGSVKEFVMGGIPRAYQSSQSQKYAERHCKDTTDNPYSAGVIRTRRIVNFIGEELEKRGFSQEYVENAKKIVANMHKETKSDKEEKAEQDGNTSKKKTKKSDEVLTNQLIVYNMNYDIEGLIEVITDTYPTEDDIKSAAEKGKEVQKEGAIKKFLDEKENRRLGSEVSRYGRMVTDGIVSNVYGSVYMNFGYSVNAISRDQDFFTATEDFLAQGEISAGSAMLDYASIDASCFYKYEMMDLNQHVDNMAIGYDFSTDEKVEAFVKEIQDDVVETVSRFIHVSPVGKQHSNATTPVPVAVYVVVTKDAFASTMDSEFANPIVYNEGKSIPEQAIQRMADFAKDDTYRDDDEILYEGWLVSAANREFAEKNNVELTTKKELTNALRQIVADCL